jgi:hypothetical protein
LLEQHVAVVHIHALDKHRKGLQQMLDVRFTGWARLISMPFHRKLDRRIELSQRRLG